MSIDYHAYLGPYIVCEGLPPNEYARSMVEPALMLAETIRLVSDQARTLWIPNVEKYHPIYRRYDCGEKTQREITPGQVRVEVERFERDYMQELIRFRTCYPHLEVAWGFLLYTS